MARQEHTPKPTTTPARPTPQDAQPVDQVKKPEAEQVDANEVTVKAVRSFEGIEGFKNPQSAPFKVSRQRAADLFANNLIEYVGGKK